MRLPNLDPLLIVIVGVLVIAALTACAPRIDISQPAICAGTAHQRNAMADAALADGGPRSRIAAANLLKVMDAACRDQI